MAWVLRGLREGIVTTPYPKRADDYGTSFKAAVSVACRDDVLSVRRDRDRCSPLSARPVPSRSARARWCSTVAVASSVAAVSRPDPTASPSSRRRRWRPSTVAGSCVPSGVETDEELARLRAELTGRVKALRRSVHMRHVDAGSDGSEEWEVAAFSNPVYDVQRLGIFFTASPRHADSSS